MLQTRLLSSADAPVLRAYLAAQADWRLMMLNNFDRSGIVDGAEPFHGIYAGQFRDGEMAGCLGFFWNGMVISHAATGHGELLALALARAGRTLTGIAGPIGDVEACIAAIAERNGMPRQAQRDTLFALPLGQMVVPAGLQSSAITVRRAEQRDLGLVIGWRRQALRETRIGQSDDSIGGQAEDEMSRLLAAGLVWVAERNGRPVAKATTIALAESRACVGGVWTPPDLRGQGFARAVVAGQLRILQGEGIARAVLFTGQHNAPAISAYRALGFTELGAWGMAFYG